MAGGTPYAGSKARMLVICAFLAVAFCGVTIAQNEEWKVPEAAKKVKNPVATTPDGVATAHAIFMDKCANCHGDKGEGDGPESGMYDPSPSNLADAKMMNSMTDGEIFYKITEGRRPMPSFKNQLSDEQRWQVVNFLRTLAPKSSSSAK